MRYRADDFANTVLNDFVRRRATRDSVQLSHRSVLASAGSTEHGAMGHPVSQHLAVGQRSTLPMTAVFLDLSDFTRRSFWDEQDDVVDLAHAVLSGFVQTVRRFGGHPLGLRGDGLFAGFGGDPGFGSMLALGACAFALDAVETGVNPWLESQGIERVQARAGVDAGLITFVRTGTTSQSEVNPLGFAANFAAKCEKVANAWEVVVGEGAVKDFGDQTSFTRHERSPKTFQRHGQRKSYDFYQFDWRRVLPDLTDIPEQLAGITASEIRKG